MAERLETLLDKGRRLRAKQRLDEALDVFRQACTERRNNPEAWAERAETAEALGARREAIDSYLHVADVYARIGLESEARAMAKRVIALEANHPKALEFLGSAAAVETDVDSVPDSVAFDAERMALELGVRRPPPSDGSSSNHPSSNRPGSDRGADRTSNATRPLGGGYHITQNKQLDKVAASRLKDPIAVAAAGLPELDESDDDFDIDVDFAPDSDVPAWHHDNKDGDLDFDFDLDTELRKQHGLSSQDEQRMGDMSGQLALKEFNLAEGSVNEVSQFVEKPTIDVVNAVATIIATSPLLMELDSDSIKIVVEQGELVKVAKGQPVYMAGQPGRSLFLILNGKVIVEQELPDKSSVERVATLRTGAFFGEKSLLTETKRSSTVRAAKETTLLELPGPIIREMAQRQPQFLRLLMRYFRARMVGALMATSPLFTPFSVEERRSLVTRFRLREVAPGYVLLRRGEKCDGLYVTLAGELVALDADGALQGKLTAGEIFGESSLLEGRAQQITIQSVVRAWVLRLPRADFAELISTHPQLLEQVTSIAMDRRDAGQSF